jgi:hypothetical protein
MNKIGRDIATLEVEKWLDHKKVKEKKRTAYEDAIETLVDAVCEGSLIVNDDFTLKTKLDFPLGIDGTIKEFVFKSRVDINTVNAQMTGVKPGDGGARILATIAALTGQSKSVLGKMDSGSEDYNIASSIALFFL